MGLIGLLRVLRAPRFSWSLDDDSAPECVVALECVGRVYTVNISMNLRCSLIPNGPTNKSSSGNALSSHAFALSSYDEIQDSSSNGG